MPRKGNKGEGDPAAGKVDAGWLLGRLVDEATAVAAAEGIPHPETLAREALSAIATPLVTQWESEK